MLDLQRGDSANAMILIADQHVFTRVEAEYSPSNRPGLQTVWRSENISSKKTTEIESHVSCFDIRESRRLQFFKLSDGKFALTQTIRLTSTPRFVCRYGRSTFLAHTIVIDRDSFDVIRDNPFVIFGTAIFLNDVDEAVETFGWEAGPVKQAEVNVESLALTTTDLRGSVKDSDLAIAQRIIEDGSRLYIQGKAEQVEIILRAVFAHLPATSRLNSTFSTNTDRCPVQRDRYLVTGGIMPPKIKELLTIELCHE